MMHDSVRYFGDLPQLRSGPRDMDRVLRIQEIWLDRWIVGIDQVHAVGNEDIAVDVRVERAEGNAPYTRIVAGHRRWLGCAFEVEPHVLGAGVEKAERNLAVGLYIG